MLTFPNAKINLGLHITEKRTDGYHNVETVFYPIDVKDAIELSDDDAISCVIHGMNIPGKTEDNICLKAFNLLKRDFDLPAQRIDLLKNIPIGAGLGGGSSDGAFLIKLLNDKFKLGLSTDRMQNYARQLGADCAFFIGNKPVYAQGKGDEFSTFDVDLSDFFLVLVSPPIHVSTVNAFAHVIPQKPLTSLKETLSLCPTTWKGTVFNDFETSVFANYPEIHQIKTNLYDAGAVFALMSGSGSSVFAIFEHPVKLPELEINNRVFYNV